MKTSALAGLTLLTAASVFGCTDQQEKNTNVVDLSPLGCEGYLSLNEFTALSLEAFEGRSPKEAKNYLQSLVCNKVLLDSDDFMDYMIDDQADIIHAYTSAHLQTLSPRQDLLLKRLYQKDELEKITTIIDKRFPRAKKAREYFDKHGTLPASKGNGYRL